MGFALDCDSSTDESLMTLISKLKVFIQHKRTIPRFSGSLNEALVEDWLHECEKIAKHKNWNENEKLLKFSNKLKGAALDYHNKELLGIKNYEEWKEKMTVKFKLEDQEFYKKGLKQLKQNPEQSVTSFAVEVNSFFVKAFGLAIMRESSLYGVRLGLKVDILAKGLRSDIWCKVRSYVNRKRGRMPSWTRIIQKAQEIEEKLILMGKLTNQTSLLKSDENFTKVYIACSAIQRQEVGYGVFFDNNSLKNVSEAVKIDSPTCNVALILASILAITQAKKDGASQLKIYTSATYLLNFPTWGIRWIENGWTKRNGSPVLNVEYWRKLLATLDQINVVWSNSQTAKDKWGLEQARQLAKFGRRGCKVSG